MDVLTKGILFGNSEGKGVEITLNGLLLTLADAVEITHVEDGKIKVDCLDFSCLAEDSVETNCYDFDDCDDCCECCEKCRDDYGILKESWDEGEITLDEANMIFLRLIENVYFNEAKKTTTVKLVTGDAFTVKCGDGDVYDKEVGLKTAMLKALVGGSKFNDVVNYWLDIEEERVKEAKDKVDKKNKKTSKKN